MPDQKTMWTSCLGGFSVMWVTKLLISQVKKRIFCPKTTKFGPKLAFLVDLGQALQAFSVPCWWVSWWLWRAGCISQDTYLLYLLDENRVFKCTQFIGAFQAAKGVLTAGPRKAVKYAGAKLKKMFKSQMKKWALSKSQMKTFEMKGRLQRADLKTNLGQQRRSVWFCHPSNQ